MAIDKAVDSSVLNAGLTSIANAIRTKGGTSAQLVFPTDFVQAINNIRTASAEALVTINGGVNETITYLGVGGSGTVTLNGNGQGSVVLPKGQYTLSGSRSGYQVTVNVQNDVETVNAWPNGAIFWYGRQVAGAMAGSSKKTNSTVVNYTARAPSLSITNVLSATLPAHGSNWNGYSGSVYCNALIDMSPYSVLKASGFWTGGTVYNGAWLQTPVTDVTSGSYAPEISFPKTTEGTIQISVAGISGSRYVTLLLNSYYSNAGSMDISAIWLE